MSGSGNFAIVPSSAIEDARVSHAALRVLAAMLTYANNDGWCHPKQETIAERLDMNRSTVAYHIKKLRELGYLETDKKGKLNYSHVLTPSTLPSKERVDPIHTNGTFQVDPVNASDANVLTPSTLRVDPIHMNVLIPSTPERTSKNVPKNDYSTRSYERVESAQPRDQPPEELITFDAILRGGNGYVPTEHFFAKVKDKYLGKIDIEQVALKVVGWCAGQTKPDRQKASTARVLNFLDGDLKDIETGGRRQTTGKEQSNGNRGLSVVGRNDGATGRSFKLSDLGQLPTYSDARPKRALAGSLSGAASGG